MWKDIIGDLHFEPEYYSPVPYYNNGYPQWRRVIQYNSCFLRYEGAYEKPEQDLKYLDPVKMWLEDRWVFIRRMYGDEFTQKLFMRCLTWNLGCNDIKDGALKERQDAVVIFLFREDPRGWFRKYPLDTYMEFWDGSCQGYVNQNMMFKLSKKVNILGPIAAIFGRDVELHISTHAGWFGSCIPVSTIERPIDSHFGTLCKEHFEDKPGGVSTWTRTTGQSSGSYYD